MFDRKQLYAEIWQIGLSKVAKQHKVPYQKLKEACEKQISHFQPNSIGLAYLL